MHYTKDMKPWKIAILGILGFALAPLFQNCSQPSVTNNTSPIEEASATHLPQLKLEMEQLANRGCSSNSDCESVPVGFKACGGPTSHFIYSSTSTDVERLEKVAHQITELERQDAIASGAMSDCSMRIAPTLACHQQVCTEVAPEP